MRHVIETDVPASEDEGMSIIIGFLDAALDKLRGITR